MGDVTVRSRGGDAVVLIVFRRPTTEAVQEGLAYCLYVRRTSIKCLHEPTDNVILFLGARASSRSKPTSSLEKHTLSSGLNIFLWMQFQRTWAHVNTEEKLVVARNGGGGWAKWVKGMERY